MIINSRETYSSYLQSPCRVRCRHCCCCCCLLFLSLSPCFHFSYTQVVSLLDYKWPQVNFLEREGKNTGSPRSSVPLSHPIYTVYNLDQITQVYCVSLPVLDFVPQPPRPSLPSEQTSAPISDPNLLISTTTCRFS